MGLVPEIYMCFKCFVCVALFLLLGNYAQLPDVNYAVVSALEAIVQEMGQDSKSEEQC